jgi:hypothetical protein
MSMIEIDNRTAAESPGSAKGGAPPAARRLTPRSIRVRNRCLVALANARSLPAPTAHDLATMGDDVNLRDAWSRWASAHNAVPRVVVSGSHAAAPIVWWRSRRVAWGILAASVLASAVVVGAQVWPLDARAADQGWMPVADSTLANANAVLLRLGQTSPGVSVSVPLSPADVAALVFRSALRRRPALFTNVEARADSLLWVRGTLVGRDGDPLRFELRGRLRVARTGTGALAIVALDVADSANAPSLSPVVIDGQPTLPPIRFALPRFVLDLRLADGNATIVTQSR